MTALLDALRPSGDAWLTAPGTGNGPHVTSTDVEGKQRWWRWWRWWRLLIQVKRTKPARYNVVLRHIRPGRSRRRGYRTMMMVVPMPIQL
ncbi:MAG TPA: hypothetical protein VFN78_06350 [Ktedonobacterales bacterium]|nr:hypothetical protein [Ktedonobacterales bacterium]